MKREKRELRTKGEGKEEDKGDKRGKGRGSREDIDLTHGTKERKIFLLIILSLLSLMFSLLESRI